MPAHLALGNAGEKDAREIKDSATLREWLETRPQLDSVIVAFRICLRATPFIYSSDDLKRSPQFAMIALAHLRCLLTMCAASHDLTHFIKDAATAASVAAEFAAGNTRVSTLAPGIVAVSAKFALRSATAVDNVSAAAAVYTASAAAFGASDAYAADATSLELGITPLSLPPWHNKALPEWFTTASVAMRSYWRTNNPSQWAFWLRWWDAATSGRPFDWQLQHDIALIPDAIWQSGPGPVAEAIARIEAEHLAARTNNGERLEINPATGLIRLVPETELPADIATYATRKMAKALAIFSDTTDNQHRSLEPAFKVIRDALDDSTNLPVELFDACASATRLVATLVRNEAVPSPEQDAKINEFVTQLREAGANILGNDPKTQDVLTRRNSILGNNALVENGEAIQFVVHQLVTISEGILVRALPRDAAIVVDPNADLSDARESRFRLFGRMVRFATFGAKGLAKGTILTAEVIASATLICSTPQFQLAWAAILRWLGFA